MNIAPTALSYWFPKIEAGGLPVPRTRIIRMPEAAQKELRATFDGNDAGNAALAPFYAEIASAAFAFPMFLRTDHTSGKHNWDETCYVRDRESIGQHVWSIVEFSEMAGIMGLPWDTWAVREMLPTLPFGACKYYGNMPICREWRVFVENNRIICHHPYWPEHALFEGKAPADLDYEAFTRLTDADRDAVLGLASRAGAAAGGAWSVDILETQRGWFVTDMAEAHKSWHWLNCVHAGEFDQMVVSP